MSVSAVCLQDCWSVLFAPWSLVRQVRVFWVASMSPTKYEHFSYKLDRSLIREIRANHTSWVPFPGVGEANEESWEIVCRSCRSDMALNVVADGKTELDAA